jgi:hypothetical protein
MLLSNCEDVRGERDCEDTSKANVDCCQAGQCLVILPEGKIKYMQLFQLNYWNPKLQVAYHQVIAMRT